MPPRLGLLVCGAAYAPWGIGPGLSMPVYATQAYMDQEGTPGDPGEPGRAPQLRLSIHGGHETAHAPVIRVT